ncbi:MAG: oxidoreductase [Anaerolineae bacterium]|jgi:NAD-reducing hydrogenase small subunit|nr:oxidoreductase [Anaerolineae bacterium]
MDKLKFASVWMGGCSGCHMSFLDLDEWLFDLAEAVEVVYSPVADIKTFPQHVDVTLVEGAIANQDHLELIQTIRKNSKLVVSFGDCAVTGNVTAMRNPLDGAEVVLDRAYKDAQLLRPQVPHDDGIVPPLVDHVVPVHAVIPVDLYIPGCPPPAKRIRAVLQALVEGKSPEMIGREMLKFG